MIRFLADEDFNGRIVRGLVLRAPVIDLVRVQDVGLSSADDAALLNWAAAQGRIMLTHDLRTMPVHAAQLISHGRTLSGIIIVDDQARIGLCIDELLLIAECSSEDDWTNTILFVPLR